MGTIARKGGGKGKRVSLCSDLVQPYNLKEDEREEGGGGEGGEGGEEDILPGTVQQRRCVIQILRLGSLKVS